jgi:hypothetical protein
MMFFKYIFYRIYEFYKNGGFLKYSEPKVPPELQGIVIITFTQFFNILSIFRIFHIQINEYVMAILILSILFINNFYFNNSKRISDIENKWKNENKKSKDIKGIIIFIYCILSCIIAISLCFIIDPL